MGTSAYFMSDWECSDEESMSNKLANELWFTRMGFVEDLQEI